MSNFFIISGPSGAGKTTLAHMLIKNFDNVILTPHIGSYAKESRINMEKQSVLNLLNNINGEI